MVGGTETPQEKLQGIAFMKSIAETSQGVFREIK